MLPVLRCPSQSSCCAREASYTPETPPNPPWSYACPFAAIFRLVSRRARHDSPRLPTPASWSERRPSYDMTSLVVRAAECVALLHYKQPRGASGGPAARDPQERPGQYSLSLERYFQYSLERYCQYSLDRPAQPHVALGPSSTTAHKVQAKRPGPITS